MLVNLHTHTRHGSYDGALSPRHIAEAYEYAGFGALAITDHDVVTEPVDVDGLIQMRGIEHTIDPDRHLHVVELPDHDFRFLAHPKFTFGPAGLEDAVAYARSTGLDGIEQVNGGKDQLGGQPTGNLVRLANDDAHNLFQVGHSCMRIPDDVDDEAGVIHAVRNGEFEIVSRAAPLRRMVGFAWKALAYSTAHVDRLVPRRVSPDRDHSVYHPRRRR